MAGSWYLGPPWIRKERLGKARPTFRAGVGAVVRTVIFTVDTSSFSNIATYSDGRSVANR